MEKLTITDLPTIYDLEREDREKINGIIDAVPDLSETQLVFGGDSLGAGYLLDNPSTQSWPAQVATMIPDYFGDFSNIAVSGQTVATMVENQSITLLSKKDTSTYSKFIHAFDGGINDLIGAGTSPADVYQSLKQYVLNAKSDGWACIFFTPTFCNKDYGIGIEAGEITRQQFIKLVTDGVQNADLPLDGLVNIAQNPFIGVKKPTIDTNYFLYDGQHLSERGSKIWANLAQPAIISVSRGIKYNDYIPAVTNGTTTSPAPASLLRRFIAGAGFNTTTGQWTDVVIGDVASPLNSGSLPLYIPTGLNNKPTIRFNASPLSGRVPVNTYGDNSKTFMALFKVISYSHDGNASLMGLGDIIIDDNNYSDTTKTGRIADVIINNGGNVNYHGNYNISNSNLKVELNTWYIMVLKSKSSVLVIRANDNYSPELSVGTSLLEPSQLIIGGGHYYYNKVANGFENYSAEFAEVVVRGDIDDNAINALIQEWKGTYGL
jgi:lysophospholipase L1-like esterase